MPERDLWQAVLMAQIEDAVSPAHIGNSGGNKARRSAEARKYLTTPSKDLETVCCFAGVDMEALIDRMRRRIAELPPLQVVERKGARVVEHDGQRHTVATWSKMVGIPVKALRNRLHNGWKVADALTVPVNTPRPGDLRDAHMRAEPVSIPKLV